MQNLIFQFLSAAIILTTGVSAAQAQQANRENLTEVKIYLVSETEPETEQNRHGLVPIVRRVKAKSPLRNALGALTGKLTKQEAKEKLFSPTFGIKLLSVRLENKTVYAYFTMPDGAAFSGDGSPFVFKDAVERTALQFPAVKKVVICLDGVLDFWSESEEPARRCE